MHTKKKEPTDRNGSEPEACCKKTSERKKYLKNHTYHMRFRGHLWNKVKSHCAFLNIPVSKYITKLIEDDLSKAEDTKISMEKENFANEVATKNFKQVKSYIDRMHKSLLDKMNQLSGKLGIEIEENEKTADEIGFQIIDYLDLAETQNLPASKEAICDALGLPMRECEIIINDLILNEDIEESDGEFTVIRNE